MIPANSRSRKKQTLKKKSLKAATFALLTLASLPGWSLPGDKEKDIEISSKGSLRGDAVKGVVTYSDTVVLKQGTLEIHSDELSTYGNIDNYEKVVAIGTPATMQQLPSVNGTMIHVRGNRIEYLVKEEKVYITGDVLFKQGGTEIDGPHFFYDVANSWFEFNAEDSAINMILEANRIESGDPDNITNTDDNNGTSP